MTNFNRHLGLDMHYPTSISALVRIRNPRLGLLSRLLPHEIRFVSPALAVSLAAARLTEPDVAKCRFSGECIGYATHTGLLDAIQGQPITQERGGLQGVNYSRLTHLQNHEDVEFCNEVIGDLLYGQLSAEGNAPFVQEVVKVVGELHDNVPSHANGAGFSCAQVYRYPNGDNKYIDFAIADAGRGMLPNVRKIKPEIATHSQAIAWCLERGNTTALGRDDMAQRLPDDCLVSPLPPSVAAFSQEDHHMGEGLWKLMELVRYCDGALFVWSGDSTFTQIRGTREARLSPTAWNGVMIEMELPVAEFKAATANQERMEELARRIGL